MKPSQLDESLLSAYLDGELSEQERKLVEEQLKVDSHWKQLYEELRSVQNLIRELPTPVLTRSIIDGPWLKFAATSGSDKIRLETQKGSQSRFALGLLAIAASLLLCVLGSFAWMRSGNDGMRIAQTQKKPTAEDLAKNIPADLPAEVNELKDHLAAPSQSNVSQDESRMSRPLEEATQNRRLDNTPQAAAKNEDLESIQEPMKAKRRSLPPMKAPFSASPGQKDKAVTASGGAAPNPSFGAASKPQVPQTATLSVPSEPMETLVAVRSNSSNRELIEDFSQRGMLRKKVENDKTTEAAKQDDFFAASPETSPGLQPQDRKLPELQNGNAQDDAKNPQRELRILRSDLPLVIEQLRELGWDIQGVAVQHTDSAERTMAASKMNQSGALQENEIQQRPPALTGVINEPTDWIRIIFESK